MNRIAALLPPADVAIPELYAQDGKGDDTIVYAKYFLPGTRWTWFATELNRESGIGFGLVVGHEVELGYFDLHELASLTRPFKVERDLHFTPTTLGAIRQQLAA